MISNKLQHPQAPEKSYPLEVPCICFRSTSRACLFM